MLAKLMNVTLDDLLQEARKANFYYLVVFINNNKIINAIAIRALFPRLIRFINDFVELSKNLGEPVEIKIYSTVTGKQIGLSETTLTLHPDFDEDHPVKTAYM